MKFPEYVCETCGARSVDWGAMCLVKGLGAYRGHDWVRMPDCLACEDTGYEPGMPGHYCTFCSKGCAVATAQVKAGVSPFDPHGVEREESDADKRAYADWGEG